VGVNILEKAGALYQNTLGSILTGGSSPAIAAVALDSHQPARVQFMVSNTRSFD